MHISLYQRHFYITLKWISFSFKYWHFSFKVWCLISHIPRDDLRPPILHNNIHNNFYFIFSTLSCTCLFSCSCCFSALQKLVEFGMAVLFWTFIGDPVHYIYHNITLFYAFNIYPDTHASILQSCIMTSSLQQFFTGYNVANYMTLSNQMLSYICSL